METIIVIVLNMFGWLCLLRFLFQLSGANMFNPLVSMFAKITNPILQPLRRVLPKHSLIDFSSGLVAIIAYFLVKCLTFPIAVQAGAFHILLIGGVLLAVKATCWIYMVAIFLTVIMSWIAPNVYSPATELARILSEPVLRPIRKVLPAMAGFDFSPMLALTGLGMLQFWVGSFGP